MKNKPIEFFNEVKLILSKFKSGLYGAQRIYEILMISAIRIVESVLTSLFCTRVTENFASLYLDDAFMAGTSRRVE